LKAKKWGNLLLEQFYQFPGIITHKSEIFCEYLCESKNILENILGIESRAKVLLFYEKKPDFENPFKGLKAFKTL